MAVYAPLPIATTDGRFEDTNTRLRDGVACDSELVKTPYVYVYLLAGGHSRPPAPDQVLDGGEKHVCRCKGECVLSFKDGIVVVGLEACFAALPVSNGTAGKHEKGGEGEGDK
ncbi:unnamed protein product [Vitrella brassicaformis CCMP3155]|uniref:Uncharacterized protein n=1 Tax=Vitrella brassicaformis (strain CCMP3155) TaxID=1169540 RepID=A0A0G4G8U3_VITBC|nr:unnamed protein product [Vitrella brassicaformis CCMP3155]|eukprot:CEM25271.1 unnamed protein product [Vitrella brassicaformis CCMP3155]